MNERIKQLSDIAYQNHLKNNPNSSFSPRADYVKEFAELIVKDCLNQLQQTAPPDITNEKLQGVVNSAHRYAIDVSGANIKEHFGVDE
jgi:hypothetical protein